MGRPRNPLRPCPACGRLTSVSRRTERLHRHGSAGVLCPGSGTRVALYALVECWMGVVADHLYERCPARVRSLPTLRAYGWARKCRGLVDPWGSDICGWCARVWQARNRGGA
jgi:hypothetical protein